MNKTCKDCIHYEVCMDYTTLKESDFAQNFKGSDVLCDHFKDKSRYIELPCAVGDFIYLIDNKIVECARVERIMLFNKTLTLYGRCWSDEMLEWLPFLSPASCIGKTVFLTKEEAEKALKGGDDNA